MRKKNLKLIFYYFLLSEMKANFLRNIMTEVEEKDSELGCVAIMAIHFHNELTFFSLLPFDHKFLLFEGFQNNVFLLYRIAEMLRLLSSWD